VAAAAEEGPEDAGAVSVANMLSMLAHGDYEQADELLEAASGNAGSLGKAVAAAAEEGPEDEREESTEEVVADVASAESPSSPAAAESGGEEAGTAMDGLDRAFTAPLPLTQLATSNVETRAEGLTIAMKLAKRESEDLQRVSSYPSMLLWLDTVAPSRGPDPDDGLSAVEKQRAEVLQSPDPSSRIGSGRTAPPKPPPPTWSPEEEDSTEDSEEEDFKTHFHEVIHNRHRLKQHRRTNHQTEASGSPPSPKEEPAVERTNQPCPADCGTCTMS